MSSFPYIPHTEEDVRSMLDAMGVGDLGELFESVPRGLRDRAALRIPDSISEHQVKAELAALAGRNASLVSFAGNGAYPHVAPAVVDAIIQRSEFATAYTPYQPEVSQGTLQGIFEFQTMIAALFGLEVANASLYDGASATAEAALMTRRVRRKRSTIVVARSIPRAYQDVVSSYLEGYPDLESRPLDWGPDGRVSLEALDRALVEEPAGVVVGYPNGLGVIEDLEAIATRTRAAGATLVSVTPEMTALGLLRAPGDAGVDIAVGEGQSLGLPLSFGGPYLGLFATRSAMVRSMPGRLVSETVDTEGRRGFVLTLATREQHIRREKATSNICTNQGLCALAATVYLALFGRRGFRDLAETNAARARALLGRLEKIPGIELLFEAPFFNEVAVRVPDARRRRDRLAEEGILAGVPLGDLDPALEDALLLCATEVHRADDMDRLAKGLGS